MDQATRRDIEEYVKPLAVGLDGMTNYGDIERMVSASESIAKGVRGLDADLLFLLAVFSGQEKWISRMGHRSRTEIFLASLAIPARTVQALFRGLGRLESAPGSPEEEIVHDAVRLEAMGAYGIARSLADGYRERMDILEMAGAIEEAASAPLRTEPGRALAAGRRQLMLEFAGRLREEFAEFSRPRRSGALKRRPRFPGAVVEASAGSEGLGTVQRELEGQRDEDRHRLARDRLVRAVLNRRRTGRGRSSSRR